MVKEAEQHAEDDKARRELIESRNQAEALIHSADKNLKEFADKVSDDDKQAIEAAVKDLREVLEGEDAEAIKSKTEALTQASMKLGEAMYKASQEAEAAGEAGADAESRKDDSGEDSTVVDADFEEVNPDEEKSDKKEKEKDD